MPGAWKFLQQFICLRKVSWSQKNPRAPITVVSAVEVGFPTLTGHGFSSPMLQGLSNVMKNVVTTCGPFASPMVTVILQNLHGGEDPTVMVWVLR